MADRVFTGNPKHLALLNAGVICWNNWREIDAGDETPHLEGANLMFANLRKANLRRVHLNRAKLQWARLEEAKLWNARLERANLQWANFEGAQLIGANLGRANLEHADVTDVIYSRKTLQMSFKAIRVSTCYGSQEFKSFAQDQDFLEEYRSKKGALRWILFRLWYITCNCGRSFGLWALWSFFFATIFAHIIHYMGNAHFCFDKLRTDFPAAMYYSVVTFTTLGFGDIVPITTTGTLVVMAEVVLGYVMLGGLISIFANKVARRA